MCRFSDFEFSYVTDVLFSSERRAKIPKCNLMICNNYISRAITMNKKPKKRSKQKEEKEEDEEPFSKEDEERIKARLRALGYID